MEPKKQLKKILMVLPAWYSAAHKNKKGIISPTIAAEEGNRMTL